MNFSEKTYSSQDGLRLYYRDYGEHRSGRLPVLCLGGLTRNSHDFHELAERLSAERRVLCPDYRGRGRSQYDDDWKHYQPATYLDDIRHLLALAGVHRAVIVGTSLGGLLTAGLAVALPCVLAGAVINDVGPDIDPRGLAAIAAYISTPLAFDDWDQAVAHMRETRPDLPADDDESWLDFARGTYRRCRDGKLRYDWDPALTNAVLGAPTPPDLWPMFRALRRIPVLCVRGALSDILSAETLGRLGRALPGMKSVTIEGVGHMPSLNESACRDAIDALLATADTDV